VIKGGGIAAISDNPPTSGSTGFGAWRATADNQFISTFEQCAFTTPAGDPAGIPRVRTQGSLDKSTDQLTGHATIDFFPTGSPNVIPFGTTTFTGKRIIVVAR
jgi:hypothetical protein